MNKFFKIMLVLLIFNLNTNAASVLWVGFKSDVLLGGVPLLEYVNPAGLFVNTYRLNAKINDSITPLGLYYEYEGTYYNDAFESDVVLYDEQTYDVIGLVDWQPVTISEALGNQIDLNIKIYFELGYVDLDVDDSEFILLGYAVANYSYLVDNNHIYQTFDLNPPIESPWRPNFDVVPEPAPTSLGILGAIVLFMTCRRKSNRST